MPKLTRARTAALPSSAFRSSTDVSPWHASVTNWLTLTCACVGSAPNRNEASEGKGPTWRFPKILPPPGVVVIRVLVPADDEDSESAVVMLLTPLSAVKCARHVSE